MGFLNNSTNSIIIDAVLTDIGRAFLARNDGSFSIVKFALGDDEVDYTTIQKYGRTVGKERIEKNTPVFEAQTGGSLALKSRLISIQNPYLIRLPTLSLTGAGFDSTGTVLSMTTGTGQSAKRTITLQQTITNENVIDVDLRDQSFIIRLSKRYLDIGSHTPNAIDSDSIATYILQRDADVLSTGGSKLTVTLSVKNITQSQFDIYGNTSDKNTISTVVSISGIQSGATKEFSVNIAK